MLVLAEQSTGATERLAITRYRGCGLQLLPVRRHVVTPYGKSPVLNGEPGTAANAPVFVLIAYPDTLLDVKLVAYTKVPDGVIAMPWGPFPARVSGDHESDERRPRLAEHALV